jgi:hypothetical protein
MTRLRAVFAGALAVGLLSVTLGACGEESPTDIGAGLLPGGLLRTVEVTIEPSRFLVWDTAFTGYGSPGGTNLLIAADQREGVLQANGLLRFGLPQRVVSGVDTVGTSATDSVPEILSTRIVIFVDTVASHAADPVNVRIYESQERWDRITASWTMRVDSPGARHPWQTPGGTRGDLLGEGEWRPGVDSIAVALDTMVVRRWSDTAIVQRGAIVVADGPNSLFRSNAVSWRINYRPVFDPDTVIVVSQESAARTFLFDPPAPTATDLLRVGGVPGWRSILRLRDGLDTLQLSCPDRPNCTLPLSAVTITNASLQLQGVASPPGFSPNDSIRVAAYAVIPTDALPLPRSPLADLVGLQATPIAPGPALGQYQVPITDLLRALAMPPDTAADPIPPYVALMAFTEGRSFGFATFSQLPPLRVVFTVGTEVPLR